MVNDDTFEGAMKKIRSIDIDFEKQLIRIRTNVCNKDGVPSGIKQEKIIDEKLLIQSSYELAEGSIDLQKVEFNANLEIEETEKDHERVLNKAEKEVIKQKHKNRAISEAAKKIGQDKFKLIMNTFQPLYEFGEGLLKENYK